MSTTVTKKEMDIKREINAFNKKSDDILKLYHPSQKKSWKVVGYGLAEY